MLRQLATRPLPGSAPSPNIHLSTKSDQAHLVATRRYALAAIFVYQLALLYRHEQGLDLNVGLKAFLKAA